MTFAALAPEFVVDEFEICRMQTLDEAAAVSTFILRPDLFGTELTPGEAHVMREHPAQAARGEGRSGAYWYVLDDRQLICAVIGTRMQENQTGIFEITAIAVDPRCQHRGIAHQLFECVLAYVCQQGGRGLMVDTSSDPSYAPMRELLTELGFEQVGRFPDFYYPGEDTLWFYQAVSQSDGPLL
jgi:ribosomal protein S18 acetylase RimI-like enzyme